MNNLAGRSGSNTPILRMFEKTSPRLIEVGAIRQLFDKFAVQVGPALAEIGPVQFNSRLDQLEQQLIDPLLLDVPNTLSVTFDLPEWSTASIVRLDRLLLFRILDAMYGGDPRQTPTAPTRPLTPLERSLAVQLAQAAMKTLQATLAELCAFTCRNPQFVASLSEAEVVTAGDYVQVAVGIVETAERIVVFMPAVGLELLREKTASRTAGKSETGIDPEWAAGFKRGVMATTVSLTATVDGPPMTINDVAALRIGSIVELDADALRRVRLESDEKPLFKGSLGQGRGSFTVLLDEIVLSGRTGAT